MKLSNLAYSTALAAACTTTAYAGGLDRATFSPSILFEQGSYVEATIATTLPQVSPAALPSFSVAENFTTGKLGFKMDVSDRFAVAMMLNNQPAGADINYGALASASAQVDGASAIALAKYKFTDNISAYGGIKYQSVSANVDLTAIGSTALTFDKASEMGYIAGVAYERPEIAMRVSLSYESQIDYELDTSITASGTPLGVSDASTPEAWTLEFQSGVAKDTLVFGSIRRANWSDANVMLLGAFALTNFEDTTSYTLGVGRKFSDSFSATASVFYEQSTDAVVSPLAPTDGILGLSLGGQYTAANGVKISSGISYSKRGDAVTSLGTSFTDNYVTTIGLKVSKSF